MSWIYNFQATAENCLPVVSIKIKYMLCDLVTHLCQLRSEMRIGNLEHILFYALRTTQYMREGRLMKLLILEVPNILYIVSV